MIVKFKTLVEKNHVERYLQITPISKDSEKILYYIGILGMYNDKHIVTFVNDSVELIANQTKHFLYTFGQVPFELTFQDFEKSEVDRDTIANVLK